nr:sporamin B [Ipomoea batatas]GMD91603.1 sporamin B [Ipomoea batatas]
MKALALFFLLSLYLLPNPAHSNFNPIRLRTAHETASSETPVEDINCNEVRADIDYNLFSAVMAIGGGLRLVRLDSSSDVIVSQNEMDIGDPITITPADPEVTVVMSEAYQTLRFNIANNQLCANNQNWGIKYDDESGQYFVKAGEFVSDNSNQFKIEVATDNLTTNKITYCQFGTEKCFNVGRYYDTSTKVTRLALSNTPFVFLIKPTDM